MAAPKRKAGDAANSLCVDKTLFWGPPVAADIGGSQAKLVYFRPENAPQMPSYVRQDSDVLNKKTTYIFFKKKFFFKKKYLPFFEVIFYDFFLNFLHFKNLFVKKIFMRLFFLPF